MFRIVQMSFDRDRCWFLSTDLHRNRLMSKYMMNLSSFHCFVAVPCRVAHKTSDKKILHLKNRPRKRDAWPQCLRRGSNAGVCDSDTARPRTWHRNLDYSTESEPERKRLEKPGCSCSKVKAWLVRRSSSIYLRFLNAVLYGEDMTPGLFRTKFVGC